MADAAPENGTHFTICIARSHGPPNMWPMANDVSAPSTASSFPDCLQDTQRQCGEDLEYGGNTSGTNGIGLGWSTPSLGLPTATWNHSGCPLLHYKRATEKARDQDCGIPRGEKRRAKQDDTQTGARWECEASCQEIGLCPMQRCWMQETPNQKRCLCTVMLVRGLLMFGSSVEQLSAVLCTTWDEP